ncbi:MAG: NADH-quinone oxidoreductase subunit NuoE [Micavibrio sp.]
MKKPLDLNASYQPESFTFKDESVVKEIIARYPEGRQQSAVMPLLDLAQRQVGEEGAKASPPHGGWIPRAAMDEIARIVGVAPMKVYEVATFYSMYHLVPVGKYLIQMCTTTPCWLCGSAKVVEACEKSLGIHAGDSTKDGMFTLMEVECLGACANAPMVQINDDYYEDLTPESMTAIIDSLKQDKIPPAGPQVKRQKAAPVGGPTTLKRAG